MADTTMGAAVRDVDGNTSSKRVAGFIALALFGGALVADGTGHHVAQHFVDDLMVIVCSCFGFALAERFAPTRS